MTLRNNPCKGREAGCTGDGSPRCENCRLIHNERERTRRQARRQACRCTVCGSKAVKVNGIALSTCAVHREYYSERARAV